MINELEKIADKIDILSAEFSKINSTLSDEWKTKSSEICSSKLKKIFVTLNEITDEIRNTSRKDVL